MSNCDNWAERAARCTRVEVGFEPYHKWMPISTVKTASSEQVTMLMCGICFHEVNIGEAFQHRVCVPMED